MRFPPPPTLFSAHVVIFIFKDYHRRSCAAKIITDPSSALCNSELREYFVSVTSAKMCSFGVIRICPSLPSSPPGVICVREILFCKPFYSIAAFHHLSNGNDLPSFCLSLSFCHSFIKRAPSLCLLSHFSLSLCLPRPVLRAAASRRVTIFGERRSSPARKILETLRYANLSSLSSFAGSVLFHF